MKNIFEYVLYIKSHCEHPDWEQSLLAKNKKEVVDKFFQMLQGEYDKEFINKNIIRL